MTKKRKLARTPNKPLKMQKDGIMRRGKANPDVIAARVDEVAQYIRAHPFASRFKLHKVFVPAYGVTWRQIDDYIKMAKIQLRKEANVSTQAAKEIGLGVVNNLLDHPDPRVVLKAEESHRDIHGYGAPTNVRVGDPEGKPMAGNVVIAPTVNFVLPAKKKHSDG